jgi:hypothetical protein
MEDWKLLVDKMKISRDPNDKAYQCHKGKPVVAIWGIGFEGRDYTLDECSAMIDFFKNDPKYGNCTVMIGIPTYWRTLKNASVRDKKLHDIVLKSDIVSPWMVGRVKNLADVDEFAFVRIWKPDVEWCKEHGIPIDAVNENPFVPFGKRKLYADIYIDDRAVNVNSIRYTLNGDFTISE